MTKCKSTKRALLLSALSLLMCVSMLIGSTFAWFTDSVTSAGNIIKSGTLDVEMYWAEVTEAPESANWTDASEGAIFNYDLWEPGYVDAKHIKIANVGSLALSYQLRVVANGTVSKLGDVIDVYYFEDATQLTRETAMSGTKLGTLTEIFGTEKNLSNAVRGDLLANTEKTVTIAFKMQESAGNEYQNLSVGTDFSVELIAIQHTYERDSFDENYDKNALSAAVPAAFVRELEDKNISATLGIGGNVENFTLDAAYQFQPTQSYEELMKSEYKYYLADFIVSADKDVPANSIALAGYYDAWCQFNNDNWVAMVNDGLEVKAGQEIGLVEALGVAVHYKDICEYGNDGIGFLCGVADRTGENAGTTITVKLCLFETTADPNGSSASSDKVEGVDPIVIGEFKYTFPEKPWDGTADTSWFDAGKTEFTISNGAQLAGMAKLGNQLGGKTITLDSDIDLGGKNWTPINIFAPEQSFTFDGGNHTIYNLNVTGRSDGGLFDNSVGTIKNLRLSDAQIESNGRSAILAGRHYGDIINCHVKDSTIEDSYWAVGGIVGQLNSGNIKNCSVTNINVKSNGGVGGIVGVLNETSGTRTIENCSVIGGTIENTGIYGSSYSGGGIVGMINISNSTVNITGCNSTATLKGEYIFEIHPPVDDDITLNIN